jgi:flagellar biosynthesis/type III secretory pathway M-ring protein FliF/YscJ
MEQWLLMALYAAMIVVALVGGYVLARRVQRLETPSEALAEARLEGQRILTRAEEEARAKAEHYRDREDATLEHRRVEMGSQEGRLAQRESTLEQRAGNLAQREELVLAR